jgi:adenylate kinase family enzyme
VRRISVVGNSGSGKSRLARELAGILAIPHIELDGIFHQLGWVPLPAEEFTSRVAAIVAGDGWVIDGNYSTVRPLVWERADTVIWLDFPRHTVMRQLILRTLRRNISRAELWNGNKERWRNFFSLDPLESVIAWSWHKHADYRQQYSAAAQDPANAPLTFIHITSRTGTRQLIAQAEADRPPSPASGLSAPAQPPTSPSQQ